MDEFRVGADADKLTVESVLATKKLLILCIIAAAACSAFRSLVKVISSFFVPDV